MKEKVLADGKLIRDKIPERASRDGVILPVIRVKGSQLKEALLRKIQEEKDEYAQASSAGDGEHCLEEAGDLLAVVLHDLRKYGYGITDVVMQMQNKARTNGGFDEGFYLLTEEQNG